jgi:hypothetical protein
MRYADIKLVESKVQLNEAEARIQHAEDLVFWEGSKGAVRAIEALKSLEQGKHTDVTIKWDGSPAIIFGRNEDGEFILTDKSGFVAKGYDGKAKSAKDLEAMFMARPGAKRDPKGFGQLASNMRDIFDEYEKATPKDFEGYFKGDLLYFNTPEIENGRYHFTPNIVTYDVDVNSELGKRIGKSKTAVVVHNMQDEQGNTKPLPNDINTFFQGEEVFVVPPVTVSKAPQVQNDEITQLKSIVAKNASAIDTMLNQNELVQKKMKSFPNVLYTYVNSKVDSGLENLGADFMDWLQNRPQISDAAKKKIAEYIQEHSAGFKAIWDTVSAIMRVKNDIIKQFDQHDADVKSSIGSKGPARPETHGDGGEGYVMTHPKGDIKLVSREYFSKANRSVER